MRTARLVLALLASSLFSATPSDAASLRCARDAVLVGTTCIDKYEASAWRIPPDRGSLIARIKRGKATLADLQAGGATQLCAVPLGNNTCSSCTFGPTFPDTGN